MANNFDYQFPPDNNLSTMPMGSLGLDFGLGDHSLFGDDQLPRGVQIGGGRRREEEMLDQTLTPTKLRPKINGTKALAEAIPPTKDGKTFSDRVSEHRREIEPPDSDVPPCLYHSPLHLPQTLSMHHSRTPSASSQMSMCLDSNMGVEFAAGQSSQGFMPMGYGMQHNPQASYSYQGSAQLQPPPGTMSPHMSSPMIHGSYPGINLPPLSGPGGYTLPGTGHHGPGIQPQFEPFASGFHPHQLQVSQYAHLPQGRHPSPMSTSGHFYPPKVEDTDRQDLPPLAPATSPRPPTIHIQTATPVKPIASANVVTAKGGVGDISSSKERGGGDDGGVDSDIDIHPFSDDDDNDDSDNSNNEPHNNVNGNAVSGSASKSPGGRPSKAKQKLVAGYVKAIQKLAREASSKSGLSTSFVITQALDPNDPRFGNCWNTWQRGYFEEFREEELKRVEPSMRPLPGQPVSPRVIRLTYQGFMAQHGVEGKKILRAWDALKRFQRSNMTVQQRIGLFNRENRKIKQIMDNLAATFNFQSALISTGGVVNQDQGICSTYETTMAEGFLQSLVKNKDEEVVRGLFRSHVYGKVAQQHLEGLENTHAADSQPSMSKKLKLKVASRKASNEGDAQRSPSVAKSSETPDGDNQSDLGTNLKKAQENVIRDCFLRLFGSKSSLKNHIHPRYMWRALGGQLANEKRQLTLYNWPENVEFPTDGTNNKGLADLTVEKRAALFRATNHPEFPLSKRGWSAEGTKENTPVIQCVPPAEGRALCLYADGTTAFDGQTLEELRSGRPAPLRIAPPTSEPESSNEPDPSKMASSTKSKVKGKGKGKGKGKSKSHPTPTTPLKTTGKKRLAQSQGSSDGANDSDGTVDSDSGKPKRALSTTYSSPSRHSSPFPSTPFQRSSPLLSSPSRSSPSRSSPSRSSPSRFSPSRSSPFPSPSPKSNVAGIPAKLKCGPSQAGLEVRLKPEVVLTSRHIPQSQEHSTTDAASDRKRERSMDNTFDKKRPGERRSNRSTDRGGDVDNEKRSTHDASDRKRDRRSDRSVDGGGDIDNEKRTKRSRTESSTAIAQFSDDDKRKNTRGTSGSRVGDYGLQFQPQGPPGMHRDQGGLMREEALRHYPPYLDYAHHPAHSTMHSFPPSHLQPQPSARSPAFYYQGSQPYQNHYVPHGPYPPHYGSPYPYQANYGPPSSHAGPSQPNHPESGYQQGGRK